MLRYPEVQRIDSRPPFALSSHNRINELGMGNFGLPMGHGKGRESEPIE